MGAGAGNEILLVVPSEQLLVVRFGSDLYDPTDPRQGFYEGFENELFEPLMAAISHKNQ